MGKYISILRECRVPFFFHKRLVKVSKDIWKNFNFSIHINFDPKIWFLNNSVFTRVKNHIFLRYQKTSTNKNDTYVILNIFQRGFFLHISIIGENIFFETLQYPSEFQKRNPRMKRNSIQNCGHLEEERFFRMMMMKNRSLRMGVMSGIVEYLV